MTVMRLPEVCWLNMDDYQLGCSGKHGHHAENPDCSTAVVNVWCSVVKGVKIAGQVCFVIAKLLY